MRALRASSVYSRVGLKTISTSRSIALRIAAPGDWAGALAARSKPGFGTSAITAACTGRTGTGGEGRRGAATGIDRNGCNGIGLVAAHLNTEIDRGLGVEGFSEARIGTTIRTTANVACTMTLSHSPVVERERGRARVLNRASLNRTDICYTELNAEACRSGDDAVCLVPTAS